MISKRVSMKSPEKSSIRRLIRYLTTDQGKLDRVGEINVTNCHSAELTWAIREMFATQNQNTRAKSDKTYHLVISFSPEDKQRLDSEKIKEIELRFCKELGFEEHQRISVLHHDTDALHLHVAINKIHPEKHTLHEPHNDFYKRKTLQQKLEIEFWLTRTKGSGIAMPEKAATMENVAGEVSLVGYVRRLVQDKIEDIKSWDELHCLLSKNGVVLKERGNGLVVESGGYVAKASSCLRSMSKSALEKRFGSFKKPEEKEAEQKGYKPQPLQAGSDALYKKYRADRAIFVEMQNVKVATALAAHRACCEAAAREYKQQKNIVYLTERGRTRQMMLKVHKARYEIRRKNSYESYQREKSTIYRDARLMSWNDWLINQAEKGSTEALETLKKRKPKNISAPLITNIKPHEKPYERYKQPDGRGVIGLTKRLIRTFAALYQSRARAAQPQRPPESLSCVRNLPSINLVSERKSTTVFLQQNAHDRLAENRATDPALRREGTRDFGNEKGYITRGGDIRGIITKKQVAAKAQELER